MAGIRWPPEDSDMYPARPVAAGDLISDDDRSVAADSWSIKSDYGSTLDDDQRHVDAAEVLSGCHFPATSDYSSDKDAPDASEVETSMLGLQNYWDATYAEDLANFHEHGRAGEVWFGVEVMDVLVGWIKNLCTNICEGQHVTNTESHTSESSYIHKDLSSWSVLDVGTGNGLLLQELAKQGFSDLTGTDYSEGAIELAQSLAVRNGLPFIKFLVDDILETKLERQFQLVNDKGTVDAIGLQQDGTIKRMMYWESMAHLVSPGGILVITACNSTKDEIVQEVENFCQRRHDSQGSDGEASSENAVFQYLDHVQTYPTVMFGGAEGSRVATVAFIRK
ncbi:uncharacterized protein [Typha angustifolia]|uniref:uncharacterized protein n=1 Tax=Typha angustifolia TaxID=59011 RepID=UPI003C2BF17F